MTDTLKQAELLPCPFCGGPAECGYHDCSNGEHHRCTKCGVEVPGDASKWNTRAALAQRANVSLAELTRPDALRLALGEMTAQEMRTAQAAIRYAFAQRDAAPVSCNPHPDAPHGFNRNASHTADCYVCDCEGWTAPVGEVFVWYSAEVDTREFNPAYSKDKPNNDGDWQPLYTHPTPPPADKVVVSDAGIDVIGAALYIYWNDVNEHARNAYRKKIRAALTAAQENDDGH